MSRREYRVGWHLEDGAEEPSAIWPFVLGLFGIAVAGFAAGFGFAWWVLL